MQLRPNYFFPLLMAAIISGCAKPTSEPVPVPKPNPIDVLMQERGYWDWSYNASFGKRKTPATVGFTRQIVFKGDGYVAISHNQQLFLESPYQLSIQIPTAHCAVKVPIAMVEFSNEGGMGNNNLKFYNVHISPTDTTLTLTGEQTCNRGGANEIYLWHRLP